MTALGPKVDTRYPVDVERTDIAVPRFKGWTLRLVPTDKPQRVGGTALGNEGR